jgi:hypothetical protein
MRCGHIPNLVRMARVWLRRALAALIDDEGMSA